ncbi:MAG: oligosaccharide flippase family protein [Bacteroidales bacterium]|nr:oligosaccharide flippase family protein [Bacteroidales bacterium]
MAAVSNSTRIAKNTFFLYLRSFFVLLISLYTSRIILKALGVEDYGIYNVVGGLIGMVSFLTSSIAATYQRYFNYEMGRKNEIALTNIFKSSITVQLIFAIIIVIIAETFGLWLLNNKLIISPERIVAARWVYHISIISLVLSIFQAPFSALIISNEKMNIFAIVSIIDAILRLIIVLALQYINYDRLIVYSILLTLISILNLLIYVFTCKINFTTTCKISLNWDKNNLKALFSFSGWGIMGSLAYTLKSQGINILLNMFFGPVVNAARGISYQVLTAVSMFITSFQTSFRPQLTKSYAECNYNYMYKLYYSASKISFFLLWGLSLPIIVETPTILNLWLGNNVPEYTVVFIRIILLTALIDVYANPTSAIAYATGDIKNFNILVSSINLSIVPIAYIFLKLGFGPASTMLVSFILTIIVQIVRLFALKKLITFSIVTYVKKVIIPTLSVLVLSSTIPYLINSLIKESLISSVFICFISVVSVILFSLTIGLNKDEKKILLSKLKFLKKK